MILPDIGNSHIISYYLHLALLGFHWQGSQPAPADFDIETERREGWAYDDAL